jgi:endonuclease/exonuclease/phosphatase family metal-dependent hydrolase
MGKPGSIRLVRVLTWNLFHGRAVPDRPRYLLDEFAAVIAGWDWDVALLQEVPPWWPPRLASEANADQRTVLTSRNWLLPLRRFIAERRPDLIKSNGGGSNAILVRPAAGTIAEHRALRLRLRPERRFVHAVRLAPETVWAANLHAQANPKDLARADIARAAATVLRWAGDAPALLGGDFNVPDPRAEGFADAGGHGIDRVLVRGLEPAGPARTLDAHGLSDHRPVLVELGRTWGPAAS